MSKTKLGGRPARGDEPERLTVRISGELKRWLGHQAVDERRDMGQIVSDALETYRRARRGRP